MGRAGRATRLFVLADARYECLRMAADVIAKKEWKGKDTTYLRARHSTIGTVLSGILDQVGKDDDVLITTPKVNDDQKLAVMDALKVFHEKQVHYYWYHAPDWFFNARESVSECFEKAKEGKSPNSAATCMRYVNPHYTKEPPKPDTSASKNYSTALKDDSRQFTNYRLMYYFMGADTIESTFKDIINVLSGNTKLAEYKEPLERFKIVRPSLAGRSNYFEDFKKRMLGMARLNKDVLIVGETGTGKEATAYFLHEFSSRRNRKFIAVNCACFTEDMLAAELFGHIKGSFTGANSNRGGRVEEADGGTIFLDEIPDASPRFQAALLRFMQSGEYSPVGSNEVKRVDVKIVAGAQPGLLHKLRDDIKHRFNERLYTYSIRELNELYRAGEIKGLPDIVSMARNLAAATIGDEKIGDNLLGYNYTPEYVTHEEVVTFWDEIKQPAVVTLLTKYEWPGNVRQLQTVISRYLCNNLKDNNGNKLALVNVLQGFIDEETRGNRIADVSAQKNDVLQLSSAPPAVVGNKTIGNITISQITSLEDIPILDEVTGAVYQSVAEALNGCLKGYNQDKIFTCLGISINTYKKHINPLLAPHTLTSHTHLTTPGITNIGTRPAE